MVDDDGFKCPKLTKPFQTMAAILGRSPKGCFGFIWRVGLKPSQQGSPAGFLTIPDRARIATPIHEIREVYARDRHLS
jgi:hypothetical protein